MQPLPIPYAAHTRCRTTAAKTDSWLSMPRYYILCRSFSQWNHSTISTRLCCQTTERKKKFFFDWINRSYPFTRTYAVSSCYRCRYILSVNKICSINYTHNVSLYIRISTESNQSFLWVFNSLRHLLWSRPIPNSIRYTWRKNIFMLLTWKYDSIENIIRAPILGKDTCRVDGLVGAIPLIWIPFNVL